jgi:putative membrane protein
LGTIMKATLLPLTALSLAVAGCSGKSDDTAASAAATDTAMADSATPGASGTKAAADSNAAMFLTDAMKGDNSEVRVAKLAAEKGSTKAVRDFATMLATDHGAHLDKVKAAAMPSSGA